MRILAQFRLSVIELAKAASFGTIKAFDRADLRQQL